MPEIPVNNPNEVNNYRNKAVWNHTAGAMTFNNSTGREYIQLAHKSGSNLTFGNQVTSEFNPNNRQTLTNGDTYETTLGKRSLMAQEMEHRVYGDVTILTGDSKLYTSPLVESYMLEQEKLATAKAGPELMQPGFGNVTGVKYEAKGDDPDPKTGSTQGKNFEPNPLQVDMQQLYKDTQKKLTPYEQLMGNGGNIKLISGKDLLLHAGVAATVYDTVFINPNGRQVVDKLVYNEDDKVVEVKETSAPYFEEKDVASHIPFGNIHIQASNKLDFNSAAGGIEFGTNGPLRMVGQGITTIGGAQVNILGGAGGGSTGHVYIKSGNLLELEASNININGRGTDVVIEPGLSVIGDQLIAGDLVVSGNLTVLGNIVCEGTIYAKDNITSDADVIASGISLVNHTHSGVQGGGSSTAPPQ
jgi:hypothetical protein